MTQDKVRVGVIGCGAGIFPPRRVCRRTTGGSRRAGRARYRPLQLAGGAVRHPQRLPRVPGTAGAGRYRCRQHRRPQLPAQAGRHRRAGSRQARPDRKAARATHRRGHRHGRSGEAAGKILAVSFQRRTRHDVEIVRDQIAVRRAGPGLLLRRRGGCAAPASRVSAAGSPRRKRPAAAP